VQHTESCRVQVPRSKNLRGAHISRIVGGSNIRADVRWAGANNTGKYSPNTRLGAASAPKVYELQLPLSELAASCGQFRASQNLGEEPAPIPRCYLPPLQA
jgi:hypothetical protein